MERVIISINLILLMGALAFAMVAQQDIQAGFDAQPVSVEVTGAQG